MADLTFTSEIGVELIQQCGSDRIIGHAARVSTRGQVDDPSAEIPEGELRGLIRYLMQHRHGTPFEHSFATFRVHAPIFVWREWHRHRVGFSYNEESARYKTLEPVFYVPPRDRPMVKVDNWKAGRPKFLTLDEAYPPSVTGPTQGDIRHRLLVSNLTESYRLAYDRYLANLSLSIDPGLARDCLPVGIYSSCWVSCNPRSLMAFLSLRTHEPTAARVSYPLYEIEVAARACEAMFAAAWPLTHAAFAEFGRVAP